MKNYKNSFPDEKELEYEVLVEKRKDLCYIIYIANFVGLWRTCKGEAMFYDLRDRMSAYVREFMLALLLVQPLLDVISFFMSSNGSTVFTTGLRLILLFTVSFYGFTISSHRRRYYVMYSVIAGFWIIHMLNCMRYGYQNPVGDLAEFLKLIQLPLWTMAFVSFFEHAEDLDVRVFGILAANFVIILGIIVVSYLFRHPVYTYDYPERNVQIGILGWFGVPNAQSAILVMLVPFALLWAFKKENFLLFSLSCLLGLGLLYFTGTRVTYYGALIIAAVFFLVIILSYRDHIRFCLPLLVALILLLALRGLSPMAQRQALTEDSQQIYQEKIDAVMGTDKDFKYKKGQEISPEILVKIEKVYTEVYGVTGIYGNSLLKEMNVRFGVQRVMEVYDYSISSSQLSNLRIKRANFVKLVMEEHGFVTKLFGFEYNKVYVDDVIFDPENDFTALLAYYGWIGTALYAGGVLYLILIALRELIQDFFGFLTLESAVAAMNLLMGFGVAQLSGHVLRRPSVLVYLALSAAMLYSSVYPPQFRRMGKYQKSKVVFIKHV